MRIAVDAMGGDYAPHEIIKGVVEELPEHKFEIVLVGQPEAVERELSRYNLDGSRISIFQAEEIIGMGEQPVQAIRRKRNSSIVVGLELVKNGQASAFVSAGSTGAITTAALLTLGKNEWVSRPALGIIFNSPSGPVLFLDVGANPDCKPKHLLQFAQMGDIYMRTIFQIPKPRIGLLSNGEEEIKGNKLVRAAYQLLAKSELNFIGNIEGQELPKGKADVVVTDGFTGNVVIKLGEGLAEVFAELSRQGMEDSLLLKEVQRRILDYTALGGALLLGIKGNVIIAHGRSDAKAIRQAIRLAEQVVEQRAAEALGS